MSSPITLLTLALLLLLPAAAQRPNIVFLLTDDQCTYSLGCYGNDDVKTPNIDRLGAEGIIFDNHYDTTAICMASRASIMTGKLEYKHGTNFDHGHMRAETWAGSYPVLLRTAGYRTAFAGKFGFEVEGLPPHSLAPQTTKAAEPAAAMPAGDFDAWGGAPGQSSYATAKNKSMAKYAARYPHSTRSYGAFATDFINTSAAQDKPFCLSISFKAPHRPVQPDPEFADLYTGTKFKKPDNFGRENGAHFAKQSTADRQYARFHDWGYDDRYDEVMAKYHAQIHGVDVAVGMIRTALEQAGVADNTIVIFTSDNGFLCGSHGYGSKVLPYEESARVPLIVYDPRHPNSGKKLRSDALTGNIDFAPTILELAGLDTPEATDGQSLLPLYDDPKATTHQSLPLINVWGNAPTHCLAIVTRDMKYLYWGYADKGFQPTEELYHTSKDPLEMHNVITNPEYQHALKQLRQSYDQELAKWNKEAVDYNNYKPFGTLFKRSSP